MDQFDKQSTYTLNKDASGHVRIWNLANRELLLDQSNLITRQGASIAARALSGLPNTGISHMYVGHNTSGTVPTPTLGDTVSSFGTHTRIPLSFSPSFANEENYASNLVYFTVYINGDSLIADGRKIVELGLVSAQSSNAADDLLFSHIAFSPIIYQSSYGLAITWGLTFRSS